MQFRNLNLVGLLTWAIVGTPSVLRELQRGTLLEPRAAAWLLSFLAFAVFFRLATRPDCFGRREIAFVAAQTVLALICVALQRDGFQPILLVIVAGQLGSRTMRVAIGWVVAQSSILALILNDQYGRDDGLAIALAYFAFQLFGVYTIQIAHREAEARTALAEANAELKLTADLLEISSRTEERLRIARDLHDVLGHNLTALSLNLETASHLTEGKAHEQIEKGKALTKVLLADVREVVSRLRSDEVVDLGAALASLRDVISVPEIHLDLRGGIAIGNPAIAQTALRSVQEIVTNAVRHSAANNLWLRLELAGGALEIHARDDGVGTDQVELGNGLRGIRERAEEAGGRLEITSMRDGGFSLFVRLPLEARA
ncbi:MAG TPA: histidine kinase [Thermoanaerobaculia bacterium]|nr:histidine kinase [Thermoanaerobaculia bacterium]